MIATLKSLSLLCAGDLMSRDVVAIPEDMSLEGAARVLTRGQVSGAPVIDADGRVVGVISSFDFVQWAQSGGSPSHFDEEVGVNAWQMVEDAVHEAATVRERMTRDAVTARPQTSVSALARMMLDAHVHRVVIVDESHRPIGIVSSMDILSAVAQHEPANLDEH